MQLIAYLNFNGDCKEAFEFYEKCLGGKIVAMVPFGETPAGGHVPAASRGQIMHARLVVGDQVLMGSDCTPQHPYQGVTGCAVALVTNDPAEGERIFNALADGGSIQMPYQETFWAVRFGMVTDRFGVPWLINCEKSA